MPTDLLGLARERAQTNLFWRYLDAQVDEAGDGWVKLRVPVRDPLRNAVGAPVHGGVLSALVDMAVGGALSTTNENAAGGVGPTTLGPKLRLLPAAPHGGIPPEGRALPPGRRHPLPEAGITDGAGKLVAVGRATYMLLSPKS